MTTLSSIHSPRDLDRLTQDRLEALAEGLMELRNAVAAETLA